MSEHIIENKVSFSKSLGTRVLQIGFFFYLMVTLTITAIQMYLEYEHTRKSVLAELVHLENTFKDGFADAVWAFDRKGLEVILSGLSKIESVAGVKIENLQKEALATVGSFDTENDKVTKTPIPAPEGVKTKFPFFKVDYDGGALFSSLFEYKFELWMQSKTSGDPPRHVGFGSFYSSQRQLYKKVEHGFFLILVNSLLKTGALWIIFSIVSSTLVTKPLGRFSKDILEIQPSNPKNTPVIEAMTKREDEIGVLANSFVKMISAVSSNIDVINDLNQNLERKVAERTLQLAEKNKNIQIILSNMKQGIFTFDHSMKITDEYSPHLESIFNTKDLRGRNYYDLLFEHCDLGENQIDQAKSAIDVIIGAASYSFDFNRHLLPAEITKTLPGGIKQILEVDWEPIALEEDTVNRMMICIRDVSQFRALQAEAEIRKIELTMIDQILSIGVAKVLKFLQTSAQALSETRNLIGAEAPNASTLNVLFRNLHNLKGNARTYNLSYAVDVIHHAEQSYSQIREGKAKWNPPQLIDELNQIDGKLKFYHNLITGKLRFLNQKDDKESKVQDALESLISRLPKQPSSEALANAFKEMIKIKANLDFARLDEILRDEFESLAGIAQALNKPAPEIKLDLGDVRFEKDKSDLLKTSMTHLFRNSLDHGIEPAEVRVGLGKPKAGCISLKSRVEGSELTIECKDDGAGLNLKVLAEKGKLPANATDEEIASVIFESGVSTATQVTDISGRGVGMDAVRAELEKHGGRIEIKFVGEKKPDGYRNFAFVIRLPLSNQAAKLAA